MRYKASIITVSDKGSRGEREDKSGPGLAEMLQKEFDVVDTVIVPDEVDQIAEAIRRQVDERCADLVVTTGGTGVAKRDVTPEATRMVIDKELPGFAEVMRLRSCEITPHAMISRAICGIRHDSIVLNLPGSPRAARECLSFVFEAIPHALDKLKGDPTDCAR